MDRLEKAIRQASLAAHEAEMPVEIYEWQHRDPSQTNPLYIIISQDNVEQFKTRAANIDETISFELMEVVNPPQWN